MTYSYEDYKRNPFLATGDLGPLLQSGSLMLFLGAGASSGFGLPDWPLLVARILKKDADPSFMKELRQKSDTDMAELIDALDDGSEEYVNKVREALYSGVAKELTDQLPRSPLLLAVAALITGSCRGRITSVITYNYDDLLKQYLGMLGYSVCVRKGYSDLSTWADVEINHVHGYIPQSGRGVSKPSEVVLSGKSYRARRANIDKGWSPYVEHGLYSKTGLFLGLSGDDNAILDVFKRVKDKIDRVADYNGYWLMTPDAFDRNAGQIRDIGMCPIMLKKEDFPRFVFAVCQEAISTS